jgi:hypothetical protein
MEQTTHTPTVQQKMVCQHYLRSACRFGERCRNLHPSEIVHSTPPILMNPTSSTKPVRRDDVPRKKGKHPPGPRDKSKYEPRSTKKVGASGSDNIANSKEFETKNRRDKSVITSSNQGFSRPRQERRRDSEYTAGRGGIRGGKNTETFEPNHRPADMRIQVEFARSDGHTGLQMESRDVIIVHGLFGPVEDRTIYNRILEEARDSGLPMDKLFKLWHGDTHMIADDRLRGEEDGKRFDYKSRCPTFCMVIDRIRDYFGMNIQATRLNWYRDDTDWKPFHFDAAAVDEAKSKIQNFTVAVSFGATREAAFEDANNEPRNRRVISMPQPNGTIYCFSKDINIHWRHGILQKPEAERTGEGRISIIAWGSVEQRSV